MGVTEKREKEKCQEVAIMVQMSPMVTLVSMVVTQDFTEILKVAVLNHKQTLVSMVEILVSMVEILDSMVEILDSMVETQDFTDILRVAVLNHKQTLVMVSTMGILAAVSMQEMMEEKDQADVQMVRVAGRRVTVGTVASIMMSPAVDYMAMRAKGAVAAGKMC